MSWSFEEIARDWLRYSSIQAMEQIYTEQLIGVEQGWFYACLAYARGGPSPHDCPAAHAILATLDQYSQRVARIHIACADAVRKVLPPERQWLASPTLSLEEEQVLRTCLAGVATEWQLTPPLGPAFLRDLADAMLDRKQLGQPHRRTLFPLVHTDSARQNEGLLAQFELERLADGTGEVFIAPEQAFTLLGPDFARIFQDAPDALLACSALQFVPSNHDVRVRIRKWLRPDTEEDALIRQPMDHGSGGGALALGLWSLWTGIPLEPGIVTSFSLRPSATGAVDGRCYAIGADLQKARDIANRKGGKGLFLVEQEQGRRLEPDTDAMGLTLLTATDLKEAIDHAIGAGRYIKRRKEDLDRPESPYSLARYVLDRYTPSGGSFLRLVLREGRDGTLEVRPETKEIADQRDLLQQRGNFVVVGAPGCGKTFTLRAIERLALQAYEHPASSKLPEPHRLPVLLPLGKWKMQTGHGKEGLKCLTLSVAPELEKSFDTYLEQGRLLFLFDALNEFPAYRDESEEMTILREWIRDYGEPREIEGQSAGAATPSPKCRFIFTCRHENYQQGIENEPDETQRQIVRLNVSRWEELQIREMARLYLRDRQMELRIDDFMAELDRLDGAAPARSSPRRLREMCANPMLLGLFLKLYADHTGNDESYRLPRNMGALFQAVCDDLFRHEAEQLAQVALPEGQVRAGLCALAYLLQSDRETVRASDGSETSGWSVRTNSPKPPADMIPQIAPALYTEQHKIAIRKIEHSNPAQAIAVSNALQVGRAEEAEYVLKAGRDMWFLELGEESLRFLHQRWQEFWTAKQIQTNLKPPQRWRARPEPQDWSAMFGHLYREGELKTREALGWSRSYPLPGPPPTGWEEPLLMLSGFHPRADDFVRRVLAHNPVLAARCLYEGGASVNPAVVTEVVSRLLAIVEDRSTGSEAVSLPVRIAAGTALGHLPDPRFPVTKIDKSTELIQPPLVTIAGTSGFLMGSTEADLDEYRQQLKERWREDWASDEQPAHLVPLAGYKLGKYPVTVREYAQFVEDGGYDVSAGARWHSCWTDKGWEWLQQSNQKAPRLWNDTRFNSPSYPVVGVTWFEAVAYVNWLNAKVRGGSYRLPTEAEWEYAARGNGRRLWPWGNKWGSDADAAQRCNGWLGDNCVGNTTPVGLYPSGATEAGIFDLVGNVWEWCHDWYDEGYYGSRSSHIPAGPEEGDYRVLRGGAWGDEPNYLRAANRDWDFPNSRFNFFGFRVASGL